MVEREKDAGNVDSFPFFLLLLLSFRNSVHSSACLLLVDTFNLYSNRLKIVSFNIVHPEMDDKLPFDIIREKLKKKAKSGFNKK